VGVLVIGAAGDSAVGEPIGVSRTSTGAVAMVGVAAT
jgi:hypothetical protein